jgi:hypothetical protein
MVLNWKEMLSYLARLPASKSHRAFLRFPFSLPLIALIVFLCHLPSRAQTNFAILAPDGAWTWYNDPRAIYHNGILYFGYVRNNDGHSVLSCLNPNTGAITELWTSTLTQTDDHDNPGLLERKDGTLFANYARHGTDQFFAYRYSSSTNPVTPADWSAEQHIAATGAGLTYANPYQLSAETNLTYDFSRDLNFNPTVFTSTNGGSNWSAPQLFIKTGTGSIRPYVKYCSDYTQRIDFLYTDGHPRDLNNSLYHLYYQGGNLYQTDGSLLKSFTNLPVLHDSGERGSVIYQYSAAPTNDYNDHIPTGRSWCWETAYQTNGAPVCVFTVQLDFVTGSAWQDDRIYYYYARWTGTNWQKRFIAQAGRPLFDPEDDYAGGICVDPKNPSTIYISSNAQNPFDTSSITNVPLRASSRYEIWRGQTSDGGLTFNWTQITTNSTTDNLRPYIPRGQTGTPAVIWFRGTYTTFTSYNCEVVGLFPNVVPQAPKVGILSPAIMPVNLPNAGNQLRVTGYATNSDPAQSLGVTWSTASGPTNAVFESPNALDTYAAFPLAGFYTLQLTATNDASSASTFVSVNASPPAVNGTDASRVLWLKLDDSSGAVASDSSGSANNGALSGGYAWQPTGGRAGGALKLYGTNAQIVVPDSALLDNTAAFTLAYWFKADAYPADSAGLVCKRDNINSNNAYTTYLKAADQKIYVDIDGSNNRFSSASLINLGVWYHVAVVFNGALATAQRASMWINGLLDVTASETSAVIPDYGSAMRIGNTHPGAVNWFNGTIDDVRFYRRALTAAEIGALAVTNFAPSITIGAVAPATNRFSSSLNGQVLDDGKGGPLTVRWSMASGPGAVTFGNSNLVATSATFNRSGGFTLRLAGSDTTAETSATTNINVAPNYNTYFDWMSQYFPGETNQTVIGPSADSDLDRAANLLEFALGMNPGLADVQPFGLHQPGLPKGSILNLNGTNYLCLTVQRPVGRLDVSYGTQISSDLSAWGSAIQVAPPVSNGDGTETVVYRDFSAVPANAQRFMRLVVFPTF